MAVRGHEMGKGDVVAALVWDFGGEEHLEILRRAFCGGLCNTLGGGRGAY